MSTQQPSETFSDQLFRFTLPQRNVRGRALRLDNVVNEILSTHDYPPAAAHLLAEALVLVALIGGLLEQGDAQLTMQAQAKGGPVSLLVVDYKDQALRGYIEHDANALRELGSNPTLEALFGSGRLVMTFDPPKTRQRYQGIVPLAGRSLAQACESYFAQSEQIPTLIRVGARSHQGKTVAGGLLLQQLAEGEAGKERLHAKDSGIEWEHIAVMGGSTSHAELTDRNLSLEALIWRLFHEEDTIRTRKGQSLARGCRCSAEHYEKILGRFDEKEITKMRNDDGVVVVDCAFCAKKISLNL